MRLVNLAAAAALTLSSAAFGQYHVAALAPMPAESPSAAPTLASNEVLFEVRTIGTASSPADQTLVNLQFRASGASAAAARSAAETLGQRLRETGRRFGAEPVQVGTGFGFPGFNFGGESVTVFGSESPDDEGQSSSAFTAAGGLRLRLGETQRFEELRDALEEAGAVSVAGPIYVLNDDTEAKRAARQDAMSKAREEAERFARAQGMRVVRLVRFSEVDNQAQMLRAVMSQFAGGAVGTQHQVETNLGAQVAFALAPQ